MEHKLYDGHTIDEWSNIGYDVNIYTHENFPLKWEKALKYGFCVKCGLVDDLDISIPVSTNMGINIVGLCTYCHTC